MSQFSLFGAAAVDVVADDLGGLVLAGGQWVRHDVRQNQTARLSVVVADRWRADALVAELAVLDLLGTEAVVGAEDGWSVRTAFTADLARDADRWMRGASLVPPPGYVLTGGGLRLWAIATGRADETGVLLGTERPDDAIHQAAGAQLSRLGVAAVSVGARGRSGWRITSVKRLRRFAELIGPAPDVPGAVWVSAG